MGEMADMLLDSWDFDYFEDDSLYESKTVCCRGCGNKDLEWRHICGRWTMMNKSGGVHTCHKYSPHIDVLKHLAEEVTRKTKEDALWRLKEKAKKRGGLTQLVNIVPDDDLIDLYTSFVKDAQRFESDPPIGISFGYDREISILKKEILKRMNK